MMTKVSREAVREAARDLSMAKNVSDKIVEMFEAEDVDVPDGIMGLLMTLGMILANKIDGDLASPECDKVLDSFRRDTKAYAAFSIMMERPERLNS